MRDLEDELRPMAIYTIVNFIWNAVRSERKKRILVIDEAWWLMQSEDSAKFIFALVKRCRKYYLGVTTITQDVNDFLTSPYGQAIVTNSAVQLLLKQSPASIDLIARVFLLTQSEKYLLLESGKGGGDLFCRSKARRHPDRCFLYGRSDCYDRPEAVATDRTGEKGVQGTAGRRK